MDAPDEGGPERGEGSGERGPVPLEGWQSLNGEIFASTVDRLRQLVIDELLAELDVPHVVVCRSVRTGATRYIGPFPDALSAAAAAEAEIALDAAAEPGAELAYRVAPLRAPGGQR